MQITITRQKFTPKCTMGTQSINGTPVCKSLEDLDRGLNADMPITEIKAKKVWAETAIPVGTYKLEKLWWEAHKNFYPHLLNVPGYEGVLMHGGVTDADTEGCILYGTAFAQDDYMTGQPEARALLIDPILKALDAGEEVYITIARDADAWATFTQPRQA